MMTFKKKITHVFALATVSTLIGCGGAETKTDTSGFDVTQPVSDWKLVWSDEFDGNAINTNHWTHEVNCTGGGNNERQCYTEDPSNSFVSDGTLKLVALPAEEGAEQPYTSARMVSKNKADFKYGRFEIKAKMPFGQGSFPAFWMMPTDEVYGGWPHSGEIDILETVNLKTVNEDGVVENNVHGTLHYGKSWPANDYSGAAYSLPDGISPADDFHVYAIEWQEGEIRWYVDGYLYATQRASELKTKADGEITGLNHRGWYSEYFDATSGELTTYWDNSPFDQQFFMILNNAVGGDWAENTNDLGVDAAAFTDGQTFEIDYIRVYQCTQNTNTGKGCETVRAAYAQEASEEVPNGALILGKAPNPPVAAIPVAPGAVFDVFSDADTDFVVGHYAASGEIVIEELDIGGDHGAVKQFTFNTDEALGYFQLAPGNVQDFRGYATLEFDIFVVNDNGADGFVVKMDCVHPCSSGDYAIDKPAQGVWTSYSILLSDLVANNGSTLDISNVNTPLAFFPTWGNQSGFVAQIDNVRIVAAGDSNGSTKVVANFYDDTVIGDIIFNSYNPDGFVTATEIAEGDRGNVIEVVKTGDTGNWYLDSSAAPLDISGYEAGSELVFDMFVVSADVGVELYIKLDSGWPNVSDIIVDSSTLGEWQEVRINLQTLLDDDNAFSAGSFADDTSIINPFVMEPTGVMTVKFDNIRYESPDNSGQQIIMYDDNVTGDIVFNSYNPDGFVTSSEIAEVDRGNVVEVVKTGGTGNWYLDSSAAPFDISGYSANSELVFDMYVVSADAGVELYIKLDSGWPNVSDVVIDSSTLGEWQEVRINLQTLLADDNAFSAGNFADATNIINPFVMEPTGVMTVKFDNIRYVNK
ncbi:glycoside hydrolase family 16 protein [Colwellia echini]|uniref:Glycoside hydrolase family 16 protein n=1 Tax=Colwellia echini TaxID=1982103 RepID=A0ABY3N1Q3_9GAMM|nr:glycoside hydrolase family 16 protein [Colwellia echini]TYK67254.1 glycoside hydrolase family 16 protein [Colwellia echini]